MSLEARVYMSNIPSRYGLGKGVNGLGESNPRVELSTLNPVYLYLSIRDYLRSRWF